MHKRLRIFFHKLLNKEYWPSFIIYFPLFPVWIYYSIRCRSFLFHTAANPGIEYGGLFMERKSKIHEILPPAFTPTTILIEPLTMNIETVISILKEQNISFPLFAKPDIGEKGTGVEKINNAEELLTYHERRNTPYQAQVLIPFKNEAGIFFIRMPDEPTGIVSGIVYKELPHVIGNGKDSVRQLAFNDLRYAMQKESIEALSPQVLNHIPANQERVDLLSYGNHARGAKFYDFTFKNSPQLEKTMNKICCVIPGFYYGRLDIKFDTWEDFADGKNFSIVELNGSGADPTHIFDPALSFLAVWKILLKHWNTLYKISKYLHKYQKIPYMSLLDFFRLRKKYNAYLKTIK